jgi:hypothetical protein
MTMKQLRKATTVTVASLGILALLAAPALAAGTGDAGKGQFQLAHMSQGQGGGWTGHAGPMGHSMHHGTDDHMGHGTGHGMMMGPAHGAAPCPGSAAVIDEDIDADVVRSWLDRSLEAHGNKRLKVGDVKATDDDTIVAEIVTVDGSLVQRLEVDRQTGRMQQVN